MLLYLSAACLALGGLYAVVTFVNLVVFRAPPRVNGGQGARVSILIPARDEASNIAAALDCVLAQQDVEMEVVVLDDGSTDGTDEIVAARAASDPRVRLIRGKPLPAGWNGKQHACHQLANEARHPSLLFLDADVRLAPDAAARMQVYMSIRDLSLVSGFPRQITRTLSEMIVIPQILVLLLGYLPFPMARLSNEPGLAAGCGQLMMVDAAAYRVAGGHEAFRNRMHDGLNLPRNVRRTGGRTDILDATPLASCRMYDNWPDIWTGFSKNATEGMAKPVALPVWTVLLFGGHILPPVVALVALLLGAPDAARAALWATGLVFLARTLLAVKVRQHPLSVILHPVGVAVTLWIQWAALIGARKGQRAEWRGRTYDVN
ncbi:4,4'-diaponeurosporenoate glycosyltransferase [Jannaschia seosinensis]|uniref:4,4'-diaponeurosporenoate glycosyltransferase n=1 Tax=Jannaschia seosinensis TaxID=313367 RepID=A0A0M7BCJ6_9RHOB|nr:glycosyltransferase family A protein [Jannaschia seosinensis]CUH40460.1 4,4'-diaponeurosporenoate glycosyltransferase [Jannaschia seosinensis]